MLRPWTDADRFEMSEGIYAQDLFYVVINNAVREVRLVMVYNDLDNPEAPCEHLVEWFTSEGHKTHTTVYRKHLITDLKGTGPFIPYKREE